MSKTLHVNDVKLTTDDNSLASSGQLATATGVAAVTTAVEAVTAGVAAVTTAVGAVTAGVAAVTTAVGAVTAAVAMDTLSVTPVTVTSASTTIQALLIAAGTTIKAAVKSMTFEPAGSVSRAVGAAAVAGTNMWTSGAAYEMPVKSTTDLRFIASGNVTMVVTQEG